MAVASYDILSFDGFLTHWAAERPEWVALSQDDRHFNYGQLEERTAKIVAMLLGLGLKKGDRIAWIGKNSDLVVREQCVFAVRDEVIFAGLHGFRLRPLQVVIGTRCAIV